MVSIASTPPLISRFTVFNKMYSFFNLSWHPNNLKHIIWGIGADHPDDDHHDNVMMIISLDLPHLHLWHFLLWLPLLIVRGWHWTAFAFFSKEILHVVKRYQKVKLHIGMFFFVHKYYFCLQSNCALKPDTRERGLELLNHIFPETSKYKSGHKVVKKVLHS